MFMPLVQDSQDKTYKLNYLFSYSRILLCLGHIIIYLQLLPLLTHLGVKASQMKTLTTRLKNYPDPVLLGSTDFLENLFFNISAIQEGYKYMN
jgi:hypothetical protein